jgi:hypothetical protein
MQIAIRLERIDAGSCNDGGEFILRQAQDERDKAESRNESLKWKRMERKTRFELATSSLARRRSSH